MNPAHPRPTEVPGASDRSRRAGRWSTARRRTFGLTAVAGVAVLAAACGSAASSGVATSSQASGASGAAAAGSQTSSAPTTASFEVATTSQSFSATVSALKSAVSSAGMMVLGTLNQAGALSVTGLHLAGAETFFVGNPTTGKQLFTMDPAVGAVLPVRMYVWAASGGTSVGYLDPVALASSVSPTLAAPAQMLAGVASKIAKAATGSAPSAQGSVGVQFTSVPSTRSFSATVSALKGAVSSAGMMVLGTLNQAGALSVTGLHLAGAESFFVGNPTTGKQLFSMDPAIGMEVPVDMYVWASGGRTTVGYFEPSPVFGGLNAKFASAGTMFDTTAAKIAKAAT